MRQRGKFAQLQGLIAWNVVRSAHRGEHLGLFHRIDPEIGLQVEIQIQHVFRIAGFLRHDLQNLLPDGIVGDCRNRRLSRNGNWSRCRGLAGQWRRRRRNCSCQVRPPLIDEPDHMRERGIVAQLAILVARNVIDLANGGEHFRLLDRVDAEIGLQVEIQVQHVFGVSRLLDHQSQDAFLDGISAAWDDGRHSGDDLDFGFLLAGCRHRRCRYGFLSAEVRIGEVRSSFVHEADDVGKRGKIAQPDLVVPLDAIGLTN